MISGVILICTILSFFSAKPAHCMELFGHRGASMVAPENTLEVVEEAFRRGYDGGNSIFR